MPLNTNRNSVRSSDTPHTFQSRRATRRLLSPLLSLEKKSLPKIPEGAKIVCTVTGHGLKDPDIARDKCGNVIPARAEKSEILRLIGG